MSPCRSSAPATAGSYADRRISARSPGVEPVAGGEVGGSEGGEHRRHLLPEYGGGAALAAAGSPDRSSGRLHVERDRDRARVALAGRAGAVDELAVRRRRPGVGAVAVLLPPVRQALAGVGQRPLHHLDGGDAARSGKPWRGRGPS